MIRYLLVFSLFSIFSFCGNAQNVELTPFDFDGRDSLLKCKVIQRYDDYVRYLNNYVDPNYNEEDRRYLGITLFKMLADDPASSSEFGVYDKSLEDLNKAYRRSEYLSLMSELTNLNYVYQKDFILSGAPNKLRTTQNPVSTDFGVTYESPFYHFNLEFIENSIRSDTLKSTLRSTKRIEYLRYLYLKKLIGRYSKSVSKEKFEEYGKEYLDIVDKYNSKCKSYDSRDTERTQECQELFKKRVDLESKISKLELKFLQITESEVDNLKVIEEKLKRSANSCNCEQPEAPEDKDGDGFSYIVDCNDNDASIYPGAKINCSNDNKDDNCDGVEDLCCTDNDNDGFYSSIGCDCDVNIFANDVFNKCDCNDADPTVYPGAKIDCNNGYTDDNCDGVKDTLQVQSGLEIKLTTLDNLYPPFGLTNFAKDRSFYVYSGLILTGLTSMVYHRVESNKWYGRYERSETFRLQDNYFDKAEQKHTRFLLSSAFTAGVFLTSFVDMRIKYAKYSKIRSQINQKNAGCVLLYELQFNPMDLTNAGFGPSLTLKF